MSKTLLAGSAEDVLQAIEQGHAAYWRGANWWLLYTIFGLPHWLPRPHGRVMRAHETRVRRAVANVVAARHHGEASSDEDPSADRNAAASSASPRRQAVAPSRSQCSDRRCRVRAGC